MTTQQQIIEFVSSCEDIFSKVATEYVASMPEEAHFWVCPWAGYGQTLTADGMYPNGYAVSLNYGTRKPGFSIRTPGREYTHAIEHYWAQILCKAVAARFHDTHEIWNEPDRGVQQIDCWARNKPRPRWAVG